MGRGTMRSFLALLQAEFVTVLRDKATLAFTFAFPVLFVLLFGPLMGGVGGSQGAHLGLVVTNGAASDVLADVIAGAGSIAVSDFDDRAQLESALARKDIDFGAVWDGKSLSFLYDPNRVQENYSFQELARGIASAFNLRRQGLKPVLAVNKVHVGKAAATNWFNLVVPGILAFSILSAGLFAVSGHLTAMKERKLLDRLIVTPMRPVALVAAIAVVRLTIVFVSTLITLFTAIGVLKLTFSVNWLQYTVLVIAATLASMGLGTIIALLVRRPASASSIANIASMLMMFLAGIYFPMEIMPSYLRALARALPLTYMANAMRYATGVSDMSVLRFWAITSALFALGIVLFPFMARYVVRAERH